MEMAGRDRNGSLRGASPDEADRARDRQPGTSAAGRTDDAAPESKHRAGPGDLIHLADHRNRPRSLLRYGIAVAAIGLTYSIKPLIESWVGQGPPLLLFLPAVTVAAWVGGLGPGLLATVVSALVCSYFYFPPFGSLAIHVSNDVFRLIVFMMEGILISALMESLHGARRKSEASTREAERYQEVSRRDEEKLRAILDNSLAVVFLKDIAGRYILLNRRFEERFHRAAGDALGKTDYDLFPQRIADVLGANDRKILDLGRAMETEELVPHEDGLHTYLSTRFPLFDAAGAAYAVGGIATDITERKRAERALRESEQWFRSLSNCSPVGVFLTDIEGRCTYTNPRCQEIYGFTEEEGLGEGWSRFIHPEDRPAVLEKWLQLAPLGGEFSLEYRTQDARGTVRWVHDRTAPVFSDQGELIGHVGTVEDVTERRQAEAALRQERDFAEGLIETAQAVVLVLDREGRIIRVNPFLERVTGFRPDEVRGLDWFTTFVPPPDRARARSAFLRVLAGSEGSQFTHPIVTREGGQRELKWAHRGLKGVGDLPRVIAIGLDITNLRTAQQRALQAERLAAIGEMVAGLAHESRNALHRGQVCLEMLALEVEDRPEALNLIARLQRAQDDLYHLFEDVRGYAAPISLELRVCNLAEVWHTTWMNLEAHRRGRETVLCDESDGLDLHCVGDPFRLEQVFRNILDNSLAVCADPVVIEIRSEAAEIDGQPALRITVRDQGPGLSPEQRQRIFEPFFTTKTRGTGLGMPITKRIIEAHGGTIAVGEGGGVGTAIILTLPRGLS
jgi:two-component system, LuxR family, sensor kinase FixL